MMKRKFFHPISKRFGVFGLVLTVLLTMVMIVANVALSRYSNTISSTLDLNKQISAGGDEATYQKAGNRRRRRHPAQEHQRRTAARHQENQRVRLR